MPTYYVATSGNNGNPGTIGSPKQTVNAGIALLSAGDTLLVRGGTYAETIPDCPSGTSWSNPVRIAAYPGESVWLIPPSDGGAGGPTGNVLFLVNGQAYIEFDGINMSNANVSGGVVQVGAYSPEMVHPHHIRIKNATMTGRTTSNGQEWEANVLGVGGHVLGGNPGGFEFQNLIITGGGRPFSGTDDNHNNGYGIYLAAPNSLVEYCDISDSGAIGIHIDNEGGDSPDNNIIRNNRIHDITRGGNRAQICAMITSGDNTQFYNNLVYNISGGFNTNAAIVVWAWPTTGLKIWNNTVYNVEGHAVQLGAQTLNHEVRNNIFASLGNFPAVQDFSDGGCIISSNYEGDPGFVNAGGGNFTLLPGSPAIDDGESLSAYFDFDFNGDLRPAGGAWDIGALEYSPSIGGNATFYVSTTGNDANDGLSPGAPKATIMNALDAMAGGDELIIRGGYYDQGIGGYAHTLPSGTSWSNYTRIAAYPGEAVWIRPSSVGNTPGGAGFPVYIDSESHYIEFDRVNVDASLMATSSNTFLISTNNLHNPHNIRIKNSELVGGGGLEGGNAVISLGSHQNFPANGLPPQTGGFQILNCVIHGGGEATGFMGTYFYNHYGIYVSSPNCLIEGNDIYDTKAAGIHINNRGVGGDPAINNVIRNNRIHDITRYSEVGQVWAIIDYEDGYNFIYNNLIYNINAGGYGKGIAISSGAANTKVWNNTVVDIAEIGIEASGPSEVRNNLVYGAPTAWTNGAGSVNSNNMFAGVDPLFVDAPSGNYRLLIGSPALDAGTTISAFNYDIEGITRPQGAAWDIGAYEGTSSVGSPSVSPSSSPSPSVGGGAGTRPTSGHAPNTASAQYVGLVAWVDGPTRKEILSNTSLTGTLDVVAAPDDAGNANRFNAAGEGIEVVAAAGWKITRPFTIACWVAVTGTPDDNTGVFGITYDNADGYPWSGITLGFNSGVWVLNWNDGADLQQVVGVSAIGGPGLYHIVGTVTGTASRLYVNAVEDVVAAGGAGTTVYTATSLLHAGNYTGISRNPNLNFIEGRLYNRALSEAEVADLYDTDTRWELYLAASPSVSPSASASPSPGMLDAVAWGVQVPAGTEDPQGWSLWQVSAGVAATVTGDANWGNLSLASGTSARSPVIDTGDTDNKTLTISRNVYSGGSGTVVTEIRGAATAFTQHATLPTWTTYTAAITRTWRYVQVRLSQP